MTWWVIRVMGVQPSSSRSLFHIEIKIAEANFFSMWSLFVISRICLGAGVNYTDQWLVGPRSIIINSCELSGGCSVLWFVVLINWKQYSAVYSHIKGAKCQAEHQGDTIFFFIDRDADPQGCTEKEFIGVCTALLGINQVFNFQGYQSNILRKHFSNFQFLSSETDVIFWDIQWK